MSMKEVQDLRSLEELLEGLSEGSAERKKLDKLIVARKRELKGQAEALLAVADLCDKAALPLGAAVPGALSILVSAGLVDDGRKVWFALSSLVGGLLWAVFRAVACSLAISARLELAQIGKVD